MVNINAERHNEAFIVDTEKDFIKIVKDIPLVVSQHFGYLEDQANVPDEQHYPERFLDIILRLTFRGSVVQVQDC